MTDLFDWKPPPPRPSRNFRNSDPATSEAAFRSVEPGIGKTHLRLLQILERVGTSTASEMMEHCGMIYNTTWRRLSEIKKAALIENTDDPPRKNSRGFGEVVFALTQKGRDYLLAHAEEPPK